MARRAGPAIALVLLVTACTGTEPSPTTVPTSTGATTTSTTTAPTTSSAPTSTTTTAPPSPTEGLTAMFAALERGDVGSGISLFRSDATWSFFETLIRLDAPLQGEFEFLVQALALGPEAVGLDLVRVELERRTALRSTYRTSACVEHGSAVRCDLVVADAFTGLTGLSETGTIEVAVDANGHISEVQLETETEGEPSGDWDSFRRWSAVEDPGTSESFDVGAIAARVELLDLWEVEGRPDLEPLDLALDPVGVVTAYLEARNTGDWTSHMRLLGGGALDNPFGSRAEFDAAALLERVITPTECRITLESERQGSFVACQVTVSDIIAETVGTAPTNPNATTFWVKDGRVVDLPEFLPSLFRAEAAIEEWAETNQPETYREACPDGIAGQSVIDGVECARFIAEFQSAWMEAVAAAYG